MLDQKLKKQVLDKLITYLAQRDHSEKELYEKLSLRFAADDILWALEQAKERNWLLPESQLSEKVCQQLNHKNKSHLYIQGFLKKKGLPEMERNDELEKQKAQKLLHNKFTQEQINSFEIQQKAYKYLAYRGFDNETIKRALRED